MSDKQPDRSEIIRQRLEDFHAIRDQLTYEQRVEMLQNITNDEHHAEQEPSTSQQAKQQPEQEKQGFKITTEDSSTSLRLSHADKPNKAFIGFSNRASSGDSDNDGLPDKATVANSGTEVDLIPKQSFDTNAFLTDHRPETDLGVGATKSPKTLSINIPINKNISIAPGLNSSLSEASIGANVRIFGDTPIPPSEIGTKGHESAISEQMNAAFDSIVDDFKGHKKLQKAEAGLPLTDPQGVIFTGDNGEKRFVTYPQTNQTVASEKSQPPQEQFSVTEASEGQDITPEASPAEQPQQTSKAPQR